MIDGAAHPIFKGFPANEPPQRLQLLQNQNQTDQIIAKSTAGESNLGYELYEADLIIRLISDKNTIPSDGPITICAARYQSA